MVKYLHGLNLRVPNTESHPDFSCDHKSSKQVALLVFCCFMLDSPGVFSLLTCFNPFLQHV